MKRALQNAALTLVSLLLVLLVAAAALVEMLSADPSGNRALGLPEPAS